MRCFAYACTDLECIEQRIVGEMYGRELQQICVLIDQRIATCISDDAVKMEKDSKENGTFERCARRVIPRGLSSRELVEFGKRVMYSVQSHYK